MDDLLGFLAQIRFIILAQHQAREKVSCKNNNIKFLSILNRSTKCYCPKVFSKNLEAP